MVRAIRMIEMCAGCCENVCLKCEQYELCHCCENIFCKEACVKKGTVVPEEDAFYCEKCARRHSSF